MKKTEKSEGEARLLASELNWSKVRPLIELENQSNQSSKSESPNSQSPWIYNIFHTFLANVLHFFWSL